MSPHDLDHATWRPSALDSHGGDIDATWASLDSIITDIDSFLSDWTDRARDQIGASAGGTEADVQQQFQALEQEKLQWEELRQRQVREIDNNANHLTQAWLRLEAEQRQFLQTNGTRRSIGTERSDAKELVREQHPAPCPSTKPETDAKPASPPVQQPVTQPPAQGPPVEPPSRRPETPVTPAVALPAEPEPEPPPRDNGRILQRCKPANASDSAARQFQRLKQEIESTRRGPRASN